MILAFNRKRGLPMKTGMDKILLYTVDNDAEARLIYLIALSARIMTIRSSQAHGAKLDKENGVLELVLASRMKEVWTVEIPGIATESLLRRHKILVRIIDHHTYESLDRAHDAHGKRVPGSLEQFLLMAEISDDDLLRWNFEPRLVHGVAVMDDRFTKGLRNEGFTPEERRRILGYREVLDRQITPDYDKIREIAENVWASRWTRKQYIVCSSTSILRTSYAVCTRSIQDALEEHPLILSDRGGRQIFVNNIELETVKLLEETFKGHRTFTYGIGRCWGIDNDATDAPKITLEEILQVLT